MDYPFPDSVLLIFCKAPIPGQVKTRLQPALSAEQAASAHVELTEMTVSRAFETPLCPVYLYCWPDSTHPFFLDCKDRYPLRLAEQRGADLGSRMQNAFREALSSYRHALLIGCDCPSLTAEDLRRALSALQDGHDAVFAPAEDGGYALVGLNEPQAELFEHMNWGTADVMARTRQRAGEAKLSVYELTAQWDVDDFADWQRYLKHRPSTDRQAR